MTTYETPSQERKFPDVPVDLFEGFRRDLLWMISSCRERVLLDRLQVEPWRVFRRHLIARQDDLWRTQQEMIESADEKSLINNARSLTMLAAESKKLAKDLGEYPQNIISRAICESMLALPTATEIESDGMGSLPEPGQQIRQPSLNERQ